MSLAVVLPAAGAAAAVLANAVLRPRLAALLLVAVVVSNASTVVGPVGPVSPYLAVLATGVAAVALGLRRGTLRPVWSPVFLLALLFLAGRAVSVAAASDAGLGRAVVVAGAKDVVYLVLLTLLLAGPRDALPLDVASAAMVAGAALAVLSGLSLVQEFLLHNATTFGGFSNVPLGADVGARTARHSGPGSDVNFWARTLVLFLPVVLSLGVARELGRWRRIWLVAAAVLLGGLYLTQSRGGLLAAGLGVGLWLLLSGRPRRQLAAVAVAVAAGVLLVPGVSSRIATLGLISTSTSVTADKSLVDRAAVQRVGLAMARDHPLLGVGAGNFELREEDYRRRYGPELNENLAPHDVYLEMLSESGVVGLAGWLAFLLGAALLGVRTVVTARRRAPPRSTRHVGAPAATGGVALPALLAAGLVAGLAGWAVASVFLHLADFAVLLTVVALVAALDVQLRGVAAAAVPAAPRVERPRRVLARLAAAGLALLLTGALVGTRPQRWEASAAATVVSPAASAYAQTVLSRGPVVASYVDVAARPRFLREAGTMAGVPPGAVARSRLAVRQAGSSAVLLVTVDSPRRADAARLAPAATAAVAAYAGSLRALYTVRPATELPVAVRRSPVEPLRVLALLVLVITAGVALAPVARRRPAGAASRLSSPGGEGSAACAAKDLPDGPQHDGDVAPG